MMDDKSRAKEAIRLIQWKDGGAHNSHAEDIVLAALECVRAKATLAERERVLAECDAIIEEQISLIRQSGGWSYSDLQSCQHKIAAIRARTATQAEATWHDAEGNEITGAGVRDIATPQPPASPSQEGGMREVLVEPCWPEDIIRIDAALSSWSGRGEVMDAAEIARLRERLRFVGKTGTLGHVEPAILSAILDALEQAQKREDECVDAALDWEKEARVKSEQLAVVTLSLEQAQEDAKDGLALLVRCLPHVTRIAESSYGDQDENLRACIEAILKPKGET